MSNLNRFGNDDYLHAVVAAMKDRGVPFAASLSEPELEEIQMAYSIRFPPDLATFLRCAVPVGDNFPDWRGESQHLQSRLDAPLEGVLYDVEFNEFWLPAWGSRPSETLQARETAKRFVDAAPKLIPVHLHRYVPSEPYRIGNPVFSVHQTDIIRYAGHLAEYFHKEFGAPLPSSSLESPDRSIRFWDELVAINDEIESAP